MRRLKPFFSYYGSKWRLSIKYPTPTFDTIIEPFAGSACYSLLHYQKNVVLYDAYDVIVQLWRYLINVTETEIYQLPLLCAGQEIPSTLSEEQKILLGFWVSKATTSPRKKYTKYTSTRGESSEYLGYWSANIRHRIATQLKFIRHWKIEHKSFCNVNNQFCSWFIDPPYEKGGERYIHNKIDYSQLANWCLNRQGQIIVCENGDADWLPFEPLQEHKGLLKTTKEIYYHKCDYGYLFNAKG